MTPEVRSRLLAVARGDVPADLLLRGGRLLDLASGEIRAADVAISGDRIAAVGQDLEGGAACEIDLAGSFLAPGLIDAHVHVESAMLPPAELGRILLACGVTTIVTDPHEIGNVCGLDGIRFMLAEGRRTPLEMFVNLPSCVPATSLSTSGATLRAEDLAELADEPGVLGLAEVMNFPGVIGGDPAIYAKIDAMRGRPIDGHCPGVGGRALQAYVAGGIESDHESTTLDEAREKLRAGLRIFLREATNAHNLDALLPLVSPATQDRLCFCTDDRTVPDLVDDGSIDHMVRRAIASGVDPMLAVRLGSLNTSEHFGLRDRGLIAPGRRADLFTFTDLAEPRAERVWCGGRLVAEEGRVLVDFAAPGPGARDTVRLDLEDVDLRFRAEGPDGKATVRVLGVVPDELLTEHRVEELAVVAGELRADPERDLLRMAVVERHRGTGRVGRGFVAGMGLRKGALAGTVAHDHHNLVLIGVDEISMRTAARAVVETGGGLAVADGETVLARLPLPIAGLMSDRSYPEMRTDLEAVLAATRRLGSQLHDPFMAMSFLALEVIPSLKLTDQGLVDVECMELVPLILDP